MKTVTLHYALGESFFICLLTNLLHDGIFYMSSIILLGDRTVNTSDYKIKIFVFRLESRTLSSGSDKTSVCYSSINVSILASLGYRVTVQGYDFY